MPPKKPTPAPASADNQLVFYALMAVMFVFVVIPAVIGFFGFDTSEVDIINSQTSENVYSFFTSFIEGLSFISVFISFIFVLGIVYAKIGYKEVALAYAQQVSAKEAIALGNRKERVVSTAPRSIYATNLPDGDIARDDGFSSPSGLPVGQGAGSVGSSLNHVIVDQPTNPKWVQIERHMQSLSQSEWRVAILEADILLYDMLNQMGFEGDSIGEMLKQADKSTFVTIDDAWKAHKIRNIIAHEGANFILTKDEADRAIRLYKRVFEEFYFI